MAYNVGWDESAPAGSVNANTIDTEFQNFKESIRERLEDAFPTWANDAIDPKNVHIHNGLAAARPASGDAAGHVYFATDTGDVSYWDGTAWVTSATGDALTAAAVLGVDTFDNRPAATASDAPLFFYATDTGALYVDAGASWGVISGGGSGLTGISQVTFTGSEVVGIGGDETVDFAQLIVLQDVSSTEIIAARVRITAVSIGGTTWEPDEGTQTSWFNNNTTSPPGAEFQGTDDAGVTAPTNIGSISLRELNVSQNAYGNVNAGTLGGTIHIDNNGAAGTFFWEVVVTLLGL